MSGGINLDQLERLAKTADVVSRAEADGPEAALFAARILHDEADPLVMGADRLSVGFYVDGKLSRMIEGRP